MNKPECLIIGAGLVGLSLANAVKNSAWHITLLDSATPREINLSDPNARSIALSYSSEKIFTEMDIWEQLAPYTTPIKTIHVSDRGHFGSTRIEAAKLNVDALGFSIPAQALAKILQDNIKTADNITLLQPVTVTHIDTETGAISYQINNQIVNLTADLIIIADGGQSNLASLLQITRTETDYQQTAIVANVTLSRAHKNTAYERFTDCGPIALLPIEEQSMALVWTAKPDEAKKLLELDDELFLLQLQQAFGFRAGYFETITKRFTYPLKLMVSEQQVINKALILGNAAHTLHPVAAQGFNLSLRDIHYLSTELLSSSQRALSEAAGIQGVAEILQQYIQHRQPDQTRAIQFTDNLISIFSNNTFPITSLRSLGLTVLDNLPPLKNYLAKRAMGLK